MSTDAESIEDNVVAHSGSKRETRRLRIVDRIRNDEYIVIKSYVKSIRVDLQEIDFYTMERLIALAVFRSFDVEDRKGMILDMVNLFYPYD